MKHSLPALPFPKDSLNPFMSAETLDFHHGKHHRSYVEKLNQLIEGTEFESEPLEEIVLRAEGLLFDNAAQAWNHTFFWNCLTPKAMEPTSDLKAAIEKNFKSTDGFQSEFNRIAANHFGSGWAWLVLTQEGLLEVRATHDADCPLRGGEHPLLVCDVWEHAYYIDYRNDRATYLKSFWNIVNWDFVSQRWNESQRLIHAA